MVATTLCCIASTTHVCQNVAFQMVALNTLCLLFQNCLAVVAMSVRSVMDSSHLSSFKHELVALLKASFNPTLIEVSRYEDLIIHIVNLV